MLLTSLSTDSHRVIYMWAYPGALIKKWAILAFWTNLWISTCYFLDTHLITSVLLVIHNISLSNVDDASHRFKGRKYAIDFLYRFFVRCRTICFLRWVTTMQFIVFIIHLESQNQSIFIKLHVTWVYSGPLI